MSGRWNHGVLVSYLPWRVVAFFFYTPHTWAMVVLTDMSYMAHNLVIGPKFLHDSITMTNFIRHNCSSQFMTFHATCYDSRKNSVPKHKPIGGGQMSPSLIHGGN